MAKILYNGDEYELHLVELKDKEINRLKKGIPYCFLTKIVGRLFRLKKIRRKWIEMEWIDHAMAIPSCRSEIVEKLDNDGYTYPHYSRMLNATVLIVDKLSLQRDCDRLGLQLSDVWPRQIELF